MKSVKFTRDPVTAEQIRKCVARAVRLHKAGGRTCDKLALEMDLSATNANGCPIDFDKLLSFDDFSFLHDITGIQHHVSRTSGRITGCFVPRSARSART